MKKKEDYQKKILISALITFVGVALFILSILDSWNMAFLIPGAILFFVGIGFDILYSYGTKKQKSIFEMKFWAWIFEKLKLKELIKIKLKIMEKNYVKKKKKLKGIIRKL